MLFELSDIRELAESIAANPAPTGDEFLDNRWCDRAVALPSSPYYRFFYQLTKKYKPEVVVELGGWCGTSAAHFAAGCPETKVVTIDHHTDPGDDVHQKAMWSAFDRYDNLNYLQGWTVDEVAEEQKGQHALGDAVSVFPIVKESLKHINKGIDILFIDSWHVKEYAEKDWKAYSQLLSDEALVIVDDCVSGTEGTAMHGIREFFDELPGEKMIINNLNHGYPQGYMKWSANDV